MIYTQIRYIAMLGPREEPKLFNVPQESLNAPLLRFLGYLPQSMFHFVYGVGQYKAFKGHSLQAGYDFSLCIRMQHERRWNLSRGPI